MVARSVIRQTVKSALSVLAVACGMALLVTGNSLMDSMDFGIAVQFQRVQREDATLNLVEPRALPRVAPEIAHLPGVRSVEPSRTVSVRFRSGHRDRRSSLEGVPRGRELVRLLDAELRPVDVPERGLLLSAKLAEVLGVHVGDPLVVEVLEGARPVREVPVAAVYESYFGMAAYIELGELCRLLGEGSAANGARIALDPLAEPALHARLKETPAVAALGLRREMLRSFEETAKESFAIMSFFTYSFALVIALGVVYNNARIILSERARELASLRVLGYRRREISSILLGEIGLLTVLALPVGLALGVGLASLLLGSMDSELYRLPIVIETSTFASAILTILAGSAVAGLWVRRHLDRLDLVAALKSRE
jgi:putative ABC transport system permease protein